MSASRASVGGSSSTTASSIPDSTWLTMPIWNVAEYPSDGGGPLT